MDGNFRSYSFVSSSDRIGEILDQPIGNFEEMEGLADRERLTFSNGFYGMCSAIFIDVRDSSGLPRTYQRPTLAKIYRAFISEMVAVLNSDPFVREVNIVGDCVWATYKTTHVNHIDDVFSIAFTANTALQLLNYHLKKRQLSPLRVGIGVDYGRVLMIKAGFNGSGINDVIYMGDVVNSAAHLAHEGGRGWGRPAIYVGADFQQNLNEVNKSLLSSAQVSGIGTVYRGDVVRGDMSNWIDDLP
ncbi:hypothetical protein OVA26_05615 [Microbacterium sp. SL62]|uniref:adenylate/guanylate cyclase domain-containing protein n=1 Tax=Microbacterium sp. SL62 TaxID=2995139 RepID=UPI002272EBC2|nr:adenylate/guanylate cyclase domain-containing protein [Microbacterium sp. SL62]MCY1716424.1 hypothetical protein [Microbacterium sp. SL62]